MADVWDGSVAPGGYVCDVCGVPTESEPCALHDRSLADDVTLAVVESGMRPASWQFCATCPDHEACASGWSCSKVHEAAGSRLGGAG